MIKKLSLNSKIKELYVNPVGHDVIKKILLQMNLSEKYIKNPIVSNLRLSTLQKVTRKKLGNNFFEVLLKLLNSESDIPEKTSVTIEKAWWKEAVFYQIYPRSFMDSNQDGIGDIKGIILKLDYLKDLGIDALWLSPIYDSPNDDNGYDIRDYYQIMKEFGSMNDFDLLIKEVHKRGMRLIMDLVVNHTSDEHAWFQDALHNPQSKYKEYYFFRKSNTKKPPNNWTSFFGGSAWSYYGKMDEWVLHLFSQKQPDLNWDCEDLRQDIITMIKWWLEKGVDGFRMDVINYISKEKGLLDGDETIGSLMGYYGIENYFYGPNLHKYLKEIRKEAFEPYEAFSVGEMPGIGMEMGKLLTGDNRGELDMFFSFDHLENPGKTRFDEYNYDLNYWKQYLIEWTMNFGNHCWMALFYNNHDNPRFLSKVNEKQEYREVLAKLLAMIQLTSKGTPFIFQGDEIGMINKEFKSIDEIKDIESINLYKALQNNRSEEDAFRKIMSGTRDHARTTMQWTNEHYGGFTQGTPWINGDEDYCVNNVKEQLEDSTSVLQFYKQLIKLRKETLAFVYGEVAFKKQNCEDYLLYSRIYEDKEYYIECNLTNKVKKRIFDIQDYKRILSNYKDTEVQMRPYEGTIYIKKREI